MKYICTNAYLKFHHANWCIHAWYNVALVACCTLIAKISSRCARAEVFAKARVCVCVHVCGWLGVLHYIYIYNIYILYIHTYICGNFAIAAICHAYIIVYRRKSKCIRTDPI